MNKRFVQVGEKINGKIRKLEQYSIQEFIDNLTTRHNDVEEDVKISIWDFFDMKHLRYKINEIKNIAHRKGYSNAFIAVKEGINDLIDKDNFGKKKK